jgi:hypothetical protein
VGISVDTRIEINRKAEHDDFSTLERDRESMSYAKALRFWDKPDVIHLNSNALSSRSAMF